MSEVAASPAGTIDAPDPGLLSRIIGVIFSPRQTYAAVAARPKWFGVLLVTLVIGAACQYVILSSPDLQDAIVDQQVRAIESRGNTVPDAQIAGIERFIGYLPYIYAGVTLLLGGLFVMIPAGILTGIFTTLMGGSAKFKQVYAIVVHSGVISAIQGIFAAALILAGVKPVGVRPAGATLGVFVPMLEETSFVALFLGTIDLILVWWVVSLAIGIGVLYRRRTGPIAVSLLGVYVVIALIVAFFRSGS